MKASAFSSGFSVNIFKFYCGGKANIPTVMALIISIIARCHRRHNHRNGLQLKVNNTVKHKKDY